MVLLYGIFFHNPTSSWFFPPFRLRGLTPKRRTMRLFRNNGTPLVEKKISGYIIMFVYYLLRLVSMRRFPSRFSCGSSDHALSNASPKASHGPFRRWGFPWLRGLWRWYTRTAADCRSFPLMIRDFRNVMAADGIAGFGTLQPSDSYSGFGLAKAAGGFYGQGGLTA